MAEVGRFDDVEHFCTCGRAFNSTIRHDRGVDQNRARLVGLGLVVGIPAAVGTARAIGAMLFGVSPAAPHTNVMVTAILAVTAALGTVVPQHRAGRVDPAVALRQG